MSSASRAQADAPRATPMPDSIVVLVLTVLLGIQPVTTDLYLPALPALTVELGAPMAQSQLTLSALLLAFGISQLVWGPLSDRFGRRPVLLWGLAAYTLASVLGALAPDMVLLIVARTVQGAAMGAAVMCARAVVRDLYTPDQGARAMSRGLTGLGVIACLAVPLGSVLADLLGWRAALLALALFGAASLALIALRFAETLPQLNPRALEPATLLRTWGSIVRNPTFLAYSALASASYGALFTFLASSSFVLIGVLGLSRLQYGAALFCASAVYVAGTVVCRRLLVRLGVQHSVALAACCTLAAGLIMAGLAAAGVRESLWALLLPMLLFMLAHGVHQPCSQSGAVSPFPRAAGAASALNGFFMMLLAFAIGLWMGWRLDGTVMPMVEGMTFWCLCIALAAWTLVRRHGALRAD